ncbi:hypothetical protein [Calycomorphotria hydatis]|uniref:Uncharacterized protein n=1 Tax=Calycomorphotria hydatis TaxID=2528027 RepID=A0A517T4M8_9PLAN|nr:hypothetical protein [Calycomorphotria hydatis]QDT63318.1 hypothetical protein V22_05380 [Calycomorphotria hydatis]
MSENSRFAIQYFFSFFLVTLIGTLASGYYGLGIIWLILATPVLVRWQMIEGREVPSASHNPPMMRVIGTFLTLFAVASVALITGAIAFSIYCTESGGGVIGPSETVFWSSIYFGAFVATIVVFVLSLVMTWRYMREYKVRQREEELRARQSEDSGRIPGWLKKHE